MEKGPESILYRDAGLAATRDVDLRLADLELVVFDKYLRHPGLLLDIGCGRGRACVYFSIKGFECVGIDVSTEDVLEACS